MDKPQNLEAAAAALVVPAGQAAPAERNSPVETQESWWSRARVEFDHVVALAFCAAAIVAATQLLRGTNPPPIAFRADALSNVANVLAPFIVISALIERAVEVIAAGWREPAAREHVAAVAAAATGHGERSAEHRAADQRRRRYKAATMQIAFMVSFTLALMVAMAGVRGVSQFLQLDGVATAQMTVLRWADVAITALMLAGGAEGIHRVVTTITALLDATKERASGAAG
jgi:hypothetical protein